LDPDRLRFYAGVFIAPAGPDAGRWYWCVNKALAIDADCAPTAEADVDRAERAHAVWKMKDAAR
jgi:hypothetical protein